MVGEYLHYQRAKEEHSIPRHPHRLLRGGDGIGGGDPVRARQDPVTIQKLDIQGAHGRRPAFFQDRRTSWVGPSQSHCHKGFR